MYVCMYVNILNRARRILLFIVTILLSIYLQYRNINMVLVYGAEAWALLCTDAAALTVFERKVLRKMRVGDDFRTRTNSDLYELRINIQRLR